jgi:hypothetical protein
MKTNDIISRSVTAVREMRGNLELARRKEARSNLSSIMDNSSFNLSLANQSIRPTTDREYLQGKLSSIGPSKTILL